ncbi:hypothetical protein [Flavobacterium sp. XGLA_31]|uniref:hypothetical protein n=1 Tax=Flavobacterium sp. XGLA_31 TaxID=3447666 RepID=UPI003F416CB7
MTLIVGRVHDENIKIYSDSKITDINSVRNNALTANLKCFILHPHICLSFSGNVHYAEKFLEKFYSNTPFSFSNILQYCLILNNESNNSTHFAVSLIDNKIMRLFKIAHGKIESEIQSFWLGDIDAYNVYQKTFLESDSEKTPFEKMGKAFEKVIKDEKLETVGFFEISVSTVFIPEISSKIFRYNLKSSAQIAPHTFQLTSENPVHLMTYGTAEDGSYSEVFLTSITIEYPAVAIHFFQGKFGILFCPALNHNKPLIFNNQPDGQEFANHIKREYNITLSGLVLKNGNSFMNILGRV